MIKFKYETNLILLKVICMKINNNIITTILLSILMLSSITGIGTALVSSNDSSDVIDIRQLNFFNDMRLRNSEYAQKKDWTLKISPLDINYYDNAIEKKLYVEVYVSDIEEKYVNTESLFGEAKNTYRVYTASDDIIKQMKQIPNDHFYASKFSPSVCMTVIKHTLQEIANNPCVYCIRVIPPMTTYLNIDDVRTMNDIAYTMANEDSTLDASTCVAVIDSGYDSVESWFSGEASDNIMPSSSYDFTDDDIDVSNGDNFHGSSVADLLVKNFGDTGTTDFSMYENRNFWVPLKVGQGTQLNTGCVTEAIEWCIAHSIDVVCMSFGSNQLMINNYCDQYWCDRFRAGVLGGTTWVAASGNDGYTNSVSYPAKSHWVIATGAYDSNPAQRESYCNYGSVLYAGQLFGYQYFCTACYWYGPQQVSAFKPDAYECGNVGYFSGTSAAAPLACADIAIGVYSPSGGQYSDGYENLFSVIHLSNEFSVSPDASSLLGDVTDTHTLWHRQVVSP